jgi:Domain of unknown function (DUF4189)
MTKRYLLAAVLGTLLPFSPAFSETFLALGLPGDDPLNGWMYAYAPTAEDAIDLCRGYKTANNKNNGILNEPPGVSEAQKACRIVADLKGECFAIASNGTATTAASALGWTTSADEETAKTQAMAKCNTQRSRNVSQCILRYSYCDVAR